MYLNINIIKKKCGATNENAWLSYPIDPQATPMCNITDKNQGAIYLYLKYLYTHFKHIVLIVNEFIFINYFKFEIYFNI